MVWTDRTWKQLIIGIALLAATTAAGCAPQVPGASTAPPLPVSADNGSDCLTDAPKPPKTAKKVTVTKVADGDSLTLSDKTKVRLVGINTPESVDPNRPVQPYGKESSAFTKKLLDGKRILMALGKTPRDKYGRTLAWLWQEDGTFINGYLVQQGIAQVYTFSDNPDHALLLNACQSEARAAKRGLWALPEYANGGEASKMDRK